MAKLERYISQVKPSGKAYQPKLPSGILGRHAEALGRLGRGITDVGEAVRRYEDHQYELDLANKSQKISGEMSVELSEAYSGEALNRDHETLLQRYRERAEGIRDRHLEGITDVRLRGVVQENYGRVFVNHMARMYDLKNQYWRDNSLAELESTITDISQAAVRTEKPDLYNAYIQGVMTQIQMNRDYGLLDATKARELQEKFLYDIEKGKWSGLLANDPLRAVRALDRGEFPNLKNREDKRKEGMNTVYANIQRYNAYEARKIKEEEKSQKDREDKTFTFLMVQAMQGDLTDEQIIHYADKELLGGTKLLAVKKFADTRNTKMVGNKEAYEDLKVTVQLGIPVDDSTILRRFLSEGEDHITGDQAAELIELNSKVRITDDKYKFAVRQVQIQFQKGPFDFGSATVRKYQFLAVSELFDRVVNGGEDAEQVMNEIINRYEDWRLKRRSSELLPLEYQESPDPRALIEQHLRVGVIGKTTANSWLILLRQQDIATQLTTERAVREAEKTGGSQ